MTEIISYKKTLSDARQTCFATDVVRSNSLTAIHWYVEKIDEMLGEVFSSHLQNHKDTVCLVALGGYGRKELCPYSDIDLLILHEGDHSDEPIAQLVRALWDMGLPMGCVVRNISECKRILGEDLATDTALLDARFLAGSKLLFRKLLYKVIEPYFKRRQKWFVDEMNAALTQGINASGTSLYVVEPDLKNGICTLRDCQRIVWATRVKDGRFTISEDSMYVVVDNKNDHHFRKVYELLLRLRCALHMTTGHHLDVLEFSQQHLVADYLGFGSDGARILMEQFFETLYTIRQLLLAYLERQKSPNPFLQKLRWSLSSIAVGKRIRLLDGILASFGNVPPGGINPIAWILEVFLLSFQYKAFPGTKLENSIRLIADNLDGEHHVSQNVNQLLIKLISIKAPIGRVVRSLYDTGVLEILIPEMSKIKCKVEYDSYHEFTVDQHTLLALSLIDELEFDENHNIAEIFKNTEDLFTLRMAALLHDLGKALKGNHEYTGAVIATNICDRLGIEDSIRDTIVFLVQNHLELSLLAFQREPEDKTIAEFALKIRDIKILESLYMLTIVDIRSVGKKTWTSWKGMQLHSTYERVRNFLSRTDKSESDKQEKVVSHQYHELLNKQYCENEIAIDVEKYPGFERIALCGLDQSHFFENIVGCLTAEGYNILSAQIATIDGKALDIFHVEPNSTTSVSSSQRIQNISKKWRRIIDENVPIGKLIEERLKLYPPKAQRISNLKDSEVLINNEISKEYTVIELHTPDRIGLLYKIAHCLSLCAVNVVSAKLSTRVSNAIDIFYVNNSDGRKIFDSAHQEKIRSEIQLLLSQQA